MARLLHQPGRSRKAHRGTELVARHSRLACRQHEVGLFDAGSQLAYGSTAEPRVGSVVKVVK